MNSKSELRSGELCGSESSTGSKHLLQLSLLPDDCGVNTLRQVFAETGSSHYQVPYVHAHLINVDSRHTDLMLRHTTGDSRQTYMRTVYVAVQDEPDPRQCHLRPVTRCSNNSSSNHFEHFYGHAPMCTPRPLWGTGQQQHGAPAQRASARQLEGSGGADEGVAGGAI